MFTDGRLSISRDGMVLEEPSPPPRGQQQQRVESTAPFGGGDNCDRNAVAGGGGSAISVIDVDLNGVVNAAGKGPHADQQRLARGTHQAAAAGTGAAGLHAYRPTRGGGFGIRMHAADSGGRLRQTTAVDMDTTMRPSSSDSIDSMDHGDGDELLAHGATVTRSKIVRTRTSSFDMNSTSVRYDASLCQHHHHHHHR